jgi:hypothetical protein
LKLEQSTVASSFRAVFVTIVFVSLVALLTIAYSVYADYAALGVVGQNQPISNISTKVTATGTTTTVYLNVTIPNRGFYDLRVELSCLSNTSSAVICTDANVTIPPGGEQTLHFIFTVLNQGQQGFVPAGVKGNLSLSLIPFASLNIIVDLSSLAGERR